MATRCSRASRRFLAALLLSALPSGAFGACTGGLIVNCPAASSLLPTDILWGYQGSQTPKERQVAVSQILNVTGSTTYMPFAGGTFAGTVTFSAPLVLSTSATVAAAGSSFSDATIVTSQFVVISTCTANQGVKITGAVGAEYKIANRCGLPVLIYPPTSAQFEAYGTNTAVSLGDGANVGVLCTSATLCRLVN